MFFTSFQLFAQDGQKVEIIIECENDGDFVNYYLLVKNFVEIEAVQGTLLWNTDSLQFVEFENQGIPSFGSSNVNLNHTDEGQVRFVWFNPGSTGATIAEDGVMFKLRFEIGVGIGKINLVGDPVQILFLDKEFEEVEVEVSSGTACVISSLNLLSPQDDKLFFYPNPAKRGQQLFMKGINDENQLREIRIYSSDGRQLLIASNTLQYGFEIPGELVPGPYYIQAVDIYDRIQSAKIIVR